ncbi:MAG: DUF2799 domain-containing protein [Pseudomonadales bacterium]|nr:DUF2799 domain-containing protein [Pseudomonadales bacterium]
MPQLKFCLILVFPLILSACASLSKDECKLANWEVIGYEDGNKGQSQAQIGKHRSACAKHGIAPDLAAYQQGHQRGVRNFCNPGRGYSMGSKGIRYNGMCPKDLEPAFLTAYRAGKKVHVARQQVKTLQNKQNKQTTELKTVKTQLRAKEGLLLSPQGSLAQKASLLLEIKDLNQRSGELAAQIKQTEKELALSRAKLNHASSVTRY